MNKYNTYIFDLDGTLLDTLGDLHTAVNHALEVHGLPSHSREEIRWMVGNGITTLVERAVGEAGVDFKALFATFSQYYALHALDTTAPYPGVIDMLRRLKENGATIAVVSNKVDSATRPLVHHFFGELVDVAMGENEAAGVRRKPAPDMVFKALEAIDQSHKCGQPASSSAVYIGDSDVDIATAKAAGLPCISVLWGFRDREFLLQHGATTFVATPEEIV